MIKFKGIKETMVMINSDELLNVESHTLDIQITFDQIDLTTLVSQVLLKLKKLFKYTINPTPKFISEDNTFFTFEVVSEKEEVAVENKTAK